MKDGPVAQRSPIPTFSERRATVLQLGLIEIGLVNRIVEEQIYKSNLHYISLDLSPMYPISVALGSNIMSYSQLRLHAKLKENIDRLICVILRISNISGKKCNALLWLYQSVISQERKQTGFSHQTVIFWSHITCIVVRTK